MKERFGRGLVWVFVALYPWAGAGCFWRESRPERGVYVEHRHGDHDEHDHERREERRESDRH